jgi:hypothetical protein
MLHRRLLRDDLQEPRYKDSLRKVALRNWRAGKK